jgi:hypothetical protein
MSTTTEQKSAANEKKSAASGQKSANWQKSAANEQKSTANGPPGAANGQPSATAPAAKLLHNIVIILNNGYAQRERQMPELHYGELVQYTTTEPGAKASMKFPNLSPYRTSDDKATEIFDSQIMELVRPFKDGPPENFEGRCYLELKDGTKVGWDPDNYTLGGGDHRVQRP